MNVGNHYGRIKPMKKKLLSAVIAGFMAATPVMAELTFSALSYRTGAYGNNGIPFADG